MKIALLTQYFKPEIGAPQNRLYEMVMGLKALGHNISVITSMPNYPTGEIYKDYKGHFIYHEQLEGLPVTRYWLYASNSKKALPRFANMLSFALISLISVIKLRKERPDFIIVESPPLLLGLTAYILCKMTHARLISNISDLWPLSAVELGVIKRGGITYRTLAGIERFVYKHSTFCMGQSEEIIDYMKSQGAKDTFLFRNGVDPSRFNNLERIPHTKGLRIVYAGLLGYAQGIAAICENINFALLNAELHIYGSGGEQKKIETYLTEHPNNGIFYHGSVASHEIPKILVNADVTLIPLVQNIYGAVPSKIYESMAAGSPIIFSGEGEGQRIIESNAVGWTTPSKDFEKIKEIIQTIVSNPLLIEDKRIQCLTCANEKYNRPKQVTSLNNYLEKSLIL